VPIFYDPMISKLVRWAEDRPLAVARMRRALGEYLVTGIKTTLPFFTLAARAADFLGRPFPHTISTRC
jgi:acetyl-CoA carboxylase biotin carboxylase subunit